MSAFQMCSSAPHRAVLGLLSVAQGAAATGALRSDLQETAPEDLIQIATFNYVHTVLAEAFRLAPALRFEFEPDAIIYLEEMQRENERRNAAVLTQLKEIGAAFAKEGMAAVTLKGAARLLTSDDATLRQRFLSDVDLLVPEDRIDLASDILKALGGVPEDRPEDRLGGRHHLAPFWSEQWTVPVELHIGTGRTEIAAALPAHDIFAAAAPAAPGLLVPSAVHRVLHLVLHAQFSDRRGVLSLLSIRDCWEASAYQVDFGADCVAEASALAATSATDTNWDGFWDASAALHSGAPPVSDWAKAAFRNFGDTAGRQRQAVAARLFGMLRTAWKTREGRKRYLSGAVTFRGWRKLIRSLSDLRHRTR